MFLQQRSTKLVKKLACDILDTFADQCGDKLLQRNWRNRTGCRKLTHVTYVTYHIFPALTDQLVCFALDPSLLEHI